MKRRMNTACVPRSHPALINCNHSCNKIYINDKHMLTVIKQPNLNGPRCDTRDICPQR